MLTNQFLRYLKERAIRKGVWFKVLDRIDRSIYNLTLKIVERVRSQSLAKQIIRIMATIQNALEHGFLSYVKTYGVIRLNEIVNQALKMGYLEASKWRDDVSFSRYLAFTKFHDNLGRL